VLEVFALLLSFICGVAIYHWGRVNGNKPGYRLIQDLAAAADNPDELRLMAQVARQALWSKKQPQ